MTIRLPQVPAPSSATLGETLVDRRSLRLYAESEIDQVQLAQLLWAAQAITGENQQRVTPSAGAQYPMEVLVVAGQVKEVRAGLYRYCANEHELEAVTDGDVRERLCVAALDEQPWVKQAPVILALVANLDAMQAHFLNQPPRGQRGERYAYLESGAMAQNICLTATALGLGAVLVGGFDDAAVAATLDLASGKRATALLCIGKK